MVEAASVTLAARPRMLNAFVLADCAAAPCWPNDEAVVDCTGDMGAEADVGVGGLVEPLVPLAILPKRPDVGF